MAVALLASVLGLVVLLVLAVVGASRNDLLGTHAWSLAQWTSQPVPVRVPVRLSEVGDIWLLRGDVALDKPRVQVPLRGANGEGRAPSGNAVDWVQRVAVKDARLWAGVGRTPERAAASVDEVPFASLLQPLLRTAFGQLVVKDSIVTIGRPGGLTEIIEIVEAEVRAARDRGVTASQGRFVLRGETVAYAATLAPATRQSGQWTVPAKVSIQSPHLSGRFDGRVLLEKTARLAGKLELASPATRPLARWLGFTLPDGAGTGALAIAGNMTWRDNVLAFDDVAVSLDQNAATGALTISLGGARPAVDGTLAFKILDLTALVGAPAPMADVSGPASLMRAALSAASPAPALRWPLLDHVDADLRVSAGKLTGLGLDAGRGAASVSLRGGVLVADIAELELAGGAANGQVRVDQSGAVPRYALRGTLKRVQLDKVIGSVVGQSASRGVGPRGVPVEGVGAVRLDLTARGRTAEEVMASLHGHSDVAVGPGRLALDLDGLLAGVRARRTLDWAQIATGATDFDEATAKVAWRNGTLVTENVQLRAAGSSVVIDGSAHPARDRLYLRLLVDNGQGLARTARLGRTQSLLVYGTWRQPKIRGEETVPGATAPAPAVATVPAAPAAPALLPAVAASAPPRAGLAPEAGGEPGGGAATIEQPATETPATVVGEPAPDRVP